MSTVQLVSHLKLAHRFTVLAVILVAGFVAYGAWSFKTLNDLKVNGPLYQRIVQGKDLIADILPPPEYIIESYLVALQAMNASPAERAPLFTRLKALKTDYDTRHDFWGKENLGGELKNQFLSLADVPAQAFYQIAFSQFVPALEKDDKAAAETALSAMKQHYEVHRTAIDKVVELTNKRNEADEAHGKTEIRTAELLMLAILLAAMGSAILFVVIITRGLLRQLGGEPEYAVRIANTIAGRDLTARVEVSDGDKTSLLASMGTMQQGLKEVIGQVNAGVNQLTQAANQLSVSAQRVADSSSGQQEATQSMASAMEEISLSIDQISQNAGDAHTIARQSGDLSIQGAAIVRKAATEMNKIADSTRESSRHIGELEMHTDKISAIAQVIKEIADQTNLLALNAAIEAARAGEQGRGFAVVADEVRKLAERTTLSTQEIGSMIESIQRETRSAVASMGESNAWVSDGVAMTTGAADSIDRIKDGTAQVAEAISDISNSLLEQSSANSQTAESVEKIARITDQNTSAVNEIAASARALEQLATSLQQAVSQFRI